MIRFAVRLEKPSQVGRGGRERDTNKIRINADAAAFYIEGKGLEKNVYDLRCDNLSNIWLLHCTYVLENTMKKTNFYALHMFIPCRGTPCQN